MYSETSYYQIACTVTLLTHSYCDTINSLVLWYSKVHWRVGSCSVSNRLGTLWSHEQLALDALDTAAPPLWLNPVCMLGGMLNCLVSAASTKIRDYIAYEEMWQLYCNVLPVIFSSGCRHSSNAIFQNSILTKRDKSISLCRLYLQ